MWNCQALDGVVQEGGGVLIRRFVKNEWMWHSVLWAGSGTGWKGLEGLFQLKDSGILSRPAALRELKGPIRSLCIPLALEGRAGLSLYYMHAS